MSLFAVKNDKGEWLYSDEYNDWVDQISLASFYDTFEDADDDIECWGLSNAYVVELTEAPAKIVVSEEEAKMLKKAKDTTIWRPAAVISKYAYNAAKDYGQEALLEDRLMRAYVIGWTVDKPKRWNVKVPHVNNGYYYKDSDGLAVFTATRGRMLKERSRFTEAEIDHYGLQDCERIPVAN
ncbi:DUF1642 domain-containing protein [Lacticaseibacillus songhuajiangensis]|uniref:DUF1642 domain-containing protein n=1 Tax=Lacticaseibacillus songhuajiangensis TaxID=1296539 RepID=UPI000F797A24|nr:DUF1642 domain-containing protein [Lacticaseibacillus songhuajiangensis]